MPQVSGYNVQWCGTHTRFDDHDPTYSPGSPPGSPLSREVEPEPECAVCFQAIGNTNCCTTACGHKFCLECLIKHSKGNAAAKCPLCRQGVTPAPPPPQQQVHAQVLHNQQQLYNLLIALRDRWIQGPGGNPALRDRWIQGPGGNPEYQWQ